MSGTDQPTVGKSSRSLARTSGSTTSGEGKKTRRRKSARSGSASGPRKLSRTRKPDDMSLHQWQVALRRQFGRQQKFKLKNLGPEPIFSEFQVTNPETKKTYRVAIRGAGLGENYCSCPDFAVNLLGTCKHIEFALEKLGRKRGAKTALAAGFQGEYSEIYLQYGAQRQVVFRPGTQCPEALKRLARRYFDSNNRLQATGYSKFHTFLKKAARGDHEVRCYDDALAFIAEVRDGELLAERVDKAFPRGPDTAALDKLLRTKLYPYQKHGALFAARAGRCLIADDMGLGKTIEAIAAAEILARTMGIQRVLIVSPTSLKHQWRSEIDRFTDRSALVVEGLLPRRKQLYAADAFFKITNYDVIYRDLEAIRAWQPDLIVLDEAQRIKNWKTRTAKTVKQLQSQYAFVLTGTPLENRLEELHSIVEFVDRFRLGPMYHFLAEHQHVDETGRVVGYRNLGKISETLQPILVRRTKQGVLDELPERLEKRFFVPMTPQQLDHHEENKEIVAKLVHKWRRQHFLSEQDQLRLQIALQNMRMSCNSTYLLDRKTDHGTKADEVAELLGEIFEEQDSKVVLFSQWVRTHEVLIRRIEKRKWEHVLFCGDVPGPQRRKLIQRFKEDPNCRLFLSTDAGGVGLNLQNASAVVVLDQPWNPAVLEQRIGRVHRLGQHRPVRVVHFIAEHTIEHGMLEVLRFKKSMFAGVLDGGKDEVFLGGTRLKRFMETVEKATGGIPQAPPEVAGAPAGLLAAPRTEPRREPAGPEAARPAAAADQTWAELMQAGAAFLGKLTQALGTGTRTEAPTGGLALPKDFIADDPATGKPCLKLPVPEPDLLRKAADLLNALAGRR